MSEEQTELDNLINELDQLECEMLQPAFVRLDKECKQVAAQNAMIDLEVEVKRAADFKGPVRVFASWVPPGVALPVPLVRE